MTAFIAYILATCVLVLMAYQTGFDNGRDAANGVCRITCERPP